MYTHTNKAHDDPFKGIPEEEVRDAWANPGRLVTEADMAREMYLEMRADYIPYTRDAMEPGLGPEGC